MPFATKCHLHVIIAMMLTCLMQATQAEPAVARIGNQTITLQELDQEGEDAIFDLQKELYDARLTILNDWIDKTVLTLEAEERGITVQALLEQESGANTATDDALVRAIAFGFGDPEDAEDPAMVDMIRERLRQGLHEMQRQALMQALRNKFAAKITLSKPERVSKLYQPSLDGLISFGRNDAPSRIVYFYDFNCAYCQDADMALEQIHASYPDDVQIVIRSARNDLNGDERRAEAGALCAARQGEFWGFHRALYPMDAEYPRSDLMSVAMELDLDLETFVTCLDQQVPLQREREEPADLGELRLVGTPAYVINGRKHTGLLDYEALRRLVGQGSGTSS